VIVNLCRDGRAGIDAGLVKRLIAAQFPQWGDLAVRPVEFDGWDNRTYRLGENLSVRLPTASGYAAAVDKEHYWLPVLAPKLPVAIPIPVAKGTPDQGYPFNWSVRQWLHGATSPCRLHPGPIRCGHRCRSVHRCPATHRHHRSPTGRSEQRLSGRAIDPL